MKKHPQPLKSKSKIFVLNIIVFLLSLEGIWCDLMTYFIKYVSSELPVTQYCTVLYYTVMYCTVLYCHTSIKSSFTNLNTYSVCMAWCLLLCRGLRFVFIFPIHRFCSSEYFCLLQVARNLIDWIFDGSRQ